MLRELVDTRTRPLPTISERSQRPGEVPGGWKKANIILVFRKGMEEHPDNYRPVSLTSIPGKAMEHLMLEAPSTHMEGQGDQEWSTMDH